MFIVIGQVTTTTTTTIGGFKGGGKGAMPPSKLSPNKFQ